MSSNEQTQLFRKQTIDRISSPEDLTDYLKVTNPGIWVVLVAVIILLAGILVWSCVGTLETTADAIVVVSDHKAVIVLKDSNTLEEGMILRIFSNEVTITDVQPDEYGRTSGKSELMLADGTYDGTVVIDKTHQIAFLINAGDS